MGRCYEHLSTREREDIMMMGRDGKRVSAIAAALHRDKSTIYREMRRNGWSTGAAKQCYRATTAQAKADARRLRCRRPKLMDDPERRRIVCEKIAVERWSPEQVEHRIAFERPDLAVSDTTIYRAVADGELDCELPGRRKMSRRLRHRGKRRHRVGLTEKRGKIAITNDIADRPEEAAARLRVGDWEGDTVAGRQGGACLVTNVDRRTRLLVGGKAERKDSVHVNAVAAVSLLNKPIESLTLDRGKEFAGAAKLQEAIGAPVYFCLPHHPWQRPTNENTNGLLRDFFPKGRSLDDVSDEEVQRVYDMLNRRPRKCLGWKCPYEVFYSESLHLI